MASAVVSDNFETGSGGVPQLGGTGATTCKAWVNFNGTGTVAIRDSYNVASITDNGVGEYLINLIDALTNSDACAVMGASRSRSAGNYANGEQCYVENTTRLRATSWNSGATLTDFTDIQVAVFSN